jgi:type IV secretory pathway VirB3-like protein
MHFDYQIFSSTYFRVLVSCLQVGVFGLNFFYLLAYISNNLMVSALLFVSVNAAMNYLILMLLWPVVQIRGVKNMRTPYLGLL